MRIRSTKPEFWRSERIGSISWDARLVLKGLESYVDDNGVGKDDIALIVADVFPRDMFRRAPETLARVTEAVSELSREGFLWRYTAQGTRLLFISWWDLLQRIDKPAKGRFPRPDGTMEFRESEIRESFRRAPEILATVTEEQGNRGTEELRALSDASLSDQSNSDLSDLSDLSDSELSDDTPPRTTVYPKAFEAWWSVYPRRDQKRSALAAWKRARKRATQEQLDEGAHRYANDPNRRPQYTKLPATWLNGDCWLSDNLPDITNGHHPLQGADLRAAENEAFKRQFNAEQG